MLSRIEALTRQSVMTMKSIVTFSSSHNRFILNRLALINPRVPLNKEGAKMRKCAFLAVAYASNIGGCATLIGTGSNLILKGMFKE